MGKYTYICIMKRIIGFLIFLVLLTGCEKYVVEISNVTLSGLYVVDWVTIVGDEGNDTIMTYQNGETFIDSNLHAPFNNIETNEFNINFETSSFSGDFEMIWLNKPVKPINWKYDTRQSYDEYFEIRNNTSYSYGYLYLHYKQPNDSSVNTMIFKIEEDGHEHLKLLSSPYGPSFESRQIRLYLTRIHP
jgi:hypothetical protein